MVPVSSPESRLQSPGAQQYYGTSRQGEASAGNQGMQSPYRSSSFPAPQYALQRENVFPERPDQPECIYYIKTGDCKFGAVCKFHHPRVRSQPPPDCILSPMGLPLRPVSTWNPFTVFAYLYLIVPDSFCPCSERCTTFSIPLWERDPCTS